MATPSHRTTPECQPRLIPLPLGRKTLARLLMAFALFLSPALGLSTHQAEAAPDTAGGYAPFTGSWVHHDFGLRVTSGGIVVAIYRSFVQCGPSRRYGCDRFVGNSIYSGGLWVTQLQRVRGSTASGMIAASADSTLDGTGITLVRQPRDLLVLTWGAPGQRMQTTFCGPKAPPATAQCGA